MLNMCARRGGAGNVERRGGSVGVSERESPKASSLVQIASARERSPECSFPRTEKKNRNAAPSSAVLMFTFYISASN